MQTFEIKTHQNGKTYEKPHFFILNKGMNSGRPMYEPCPNCFVVTIENEQEKIRLFQLALVLQKGRYFELYLKGSVIPFIGIKDAKKVILNALKTTNQIELTNQFQQLIKIEALENNLSNQLKTIRNFKNCLLRSFDF